MYCVLLEIRKTLYKEVGEELKKLSLNRFAAAEIVANQERVILGIFLYG